MRISIFFILMAGFSLILSACKSQPASIEANLADIDRLSDVLNNEILPDMESMAKSNTLPGKPDTTDATIHLSPGLCNVNKSTTAQRVILTIEPRNLYSQGEFRYVYTKTKSVDKWRLRSAWVTTANGSRRLLDVDRIGKHHNVESVRTVDAPLESPQSAEEGNEDSGEVSLNFSNTKRYESAEKYFLHVGNSDLLPGVSKRNWSMYDMVPIPKRLEQERELRYAEAMITLKDGSAEYFYVLKPRSSEASWRVASVLKLNADGTAVMLPVK